VIRYALLRKELQPTIAEGMSPLRPVTKPWMKGKGPGGNPRALCSPNRPEPSTDQEELAGLDEVSRDDLMELRDEGGLDDCAQVQIEKWAGVAGPPLLPASEAMKSRSDSRRRSPSLSFSGLSSSSQDRMQPQAGSPCVYFDIA
jgi:hypothetical protein